MTVDMVNHPPHYTAGDIECIDAIRAALGHEGFIAYCKGQVIKYNWRAGLKGPALEDAKKAAWYQARMISETEKAPPATVAVVQRASDAEMREAMAAALQSVLPLMERDDPECGHCGQVGHGSCDGPCLADGGLSGPLVTEGLQIVEHAEIRSDGQVSNLRRYNPVDELSSDQQSRAAYVAAMARRP